MVVRFMAALPVTTTQVPSQEVQKIVNIYNTLQTTNLTTQGTQTITSSQNIETTAQIISEKTQISKEKVMKVLKHQSEISNTNKDVKQIISEISQKENIKESDIKNVIQNQFSLIAEPEKNIEKRRRLC